MDILESAAAVRQDLARVPGMYQVPAPGDAMFVLRDFLDDKECRAMIALIDAGKEPSRLLADTHDPEFRTRESCNLDPRAPATLAYEGDRRGVVSGMSVE